MEKCPGCGKSFVRLAAHKCDGKQSHKDDDKPKDKCPGCGKSFVRLGAHKCDGKQSLKDDDKPKDKCPGCGKSFVRLAAHKCDGKQSHKDDDKPKDKCPGCGKSFVRLAAHKCDGKQSPKDDDKPKDKCPGCGKSFVRLGAHKCDGKQSLKDDDKPKDKCPGCGKSFVRLGAHKCDGKQSHKDDDKPKDKCPGCGKSFVRLGAHKCDGKQSSKDDDKPKDKCPGCGKSFNRLGAHKCKGREDLSFAERCETCKKITQGSHNCKPQPTRLPEMSHDPIYNPDPKAALDQIIQEVKLDKGDIKHGAEFIKDISKNFVEDLNKIDTHFQWKILTSGSYYEKVKVCKPNEFDLMMVATPPCEAHYAPSSPDYCSLEIPEPKRSAMSELLTDGKWLSPKALKAHVLKLLPKALEQFRLSRQIELEVVQSRKSPALNLRCTRQAYPREVASPVTYDVDLVPSMELPKFPPFAAHKKKYQDAKTHVVAKTAAQEMQLGPNRDKLWRLSFSNIEKEIILHANSGQKSCRKLVFRVLKYILEKAKEKYNIRGLSSYHIKTFMLYQYDGFPADESWCHTMLRTRLHHCIPQLQRVLKEKKLVHYFLTSVNLTKDLDNRDIDSFVGVLDEYIRNI
ncbi:cyclic GMP-AMP synthase-like [Liolophura sinensis]|uniref:cyclic GMP-AMP synthase-like n=1 Tax=Liolophura sinensis TaxID=3198878 RepID=UPI0031582504